jgi:hypothetical protein
MLIGLQDFSHIYFVTATWPGQSRQTSLAVGGKALRFSLGARGCQVANWPMIIILFIV